jgi:transposase-like protein
MSNVKKHGYAECLKYMHMIEKGRTIGSIHKAYGIGHERLQVLWARYLSEGPSGLLKRKNIKADYALKRKIVLDIEENHLTLHAASIKYGPSPDRIKVWHRIYRAEGLSGLERVKKRGRPPGMGRPKKNSRPLSELERLQKENQELRTEIALLKKVRALVEERNARLREIGQGPSKN